MAIVPTVASGPGLGPADDPWPPLGAGSLLHGLDFSSAYIERNKVPRPEGYGEQENGVLCGQGVSFVGVIKQVAQEDPCAGGGPGY